MVNIGTTHQLYSNYGTILQSLYTPSLYDLRIIKKTKNCIPDDCIKKNDVIKCLISGSYLICNISDELKCDYDIARHSINSHIGNFKYLSKNIRNNPYIITLAVNKYMKTNNKFHIKEDLKKFRKKEYTILKYISKDIYNYILSLEGEYLDEKIDSFIIINSTKHKKGAHI